MKTIIVIPTYNEAESILGTIEKIFKYVPNDVLILVVDDQSPDGTADLVREHFGITSPSLYKGWVPSTPSPASNDDCLKNSRIKVLVRTTQRSFGQSYLEGFTKALEDPATKAIFEMDADLSHHPRYLPEMLKTLQEHDVVIGSRYIPGGDVSNFSWHRKLMSHAANWYARALTRLPIRDITAGFIGYRRHVLERIPFEKIMSDGYGFQIEMKFHAYKIGASFKEIPISFRDRYNGKSKMNKKMVWEGLKIGWKLH